MPRATALNTAWPLRHLESPGLQKPPMASHWAQKPPGKGPWHKQKDLTQTDGASGDGDKPGSACRAGFKEVGQKDWDNLGSSLRETPK